MPYDPYTDHKTAFAKNGFIGPIPLLTPQQSSFLARHLVGLPTDRSRWMKSVAASDPISFEVASNPDLLRIVRDLLIEGEIAVLGQRIIPPAVVFFPAGHLHDMRVVGQKPAKYVCWEFHRTEPGQIPVLAQEPAEILAQ